MNFHLIFFFDLNISLNSLRILKLLYNSFNFVYFGIKLIIKYYTVNNVKNKSQGLLMKSHDNLNFNSFSITSISIVQVSNFLKANINCLYYFNLSIIVI